MSMNGCSFAQILLLLFALAVVQAARSRERIHYTTKYECEGKEMNITCPQDSHIHLVRANYGRLSIGICNDNGKLDWSVNCMSYKSFLIMTDRCSQKSQCAIHVSSGIFGDPCPGTLKYLEIQYHCVPASAMHQSPSILNSTPMQASGKSTKQNATLSQGVDGKQDMDVDTVSVDGEEDDEEDPDVAVEAGVITSTTAAAVAISSTTTTTVRPQPISTTRSAPRFTSTTPATILQSSTEDAVLAEDIPVGVRDEFCTPTFARDLYWNWTRAGKVLVQKCPGGATGVARWQCSIAGVQWSPEKPDMRQCRSLWVENLRERLEGGESIISVAMDLSLMTLTKSLFSQDVKHIAAIVQQMLSRAVESMESFLDVWHRENVFKELLDAISETVSNLLEDKQRPAWSDLTSGEQKQVLTMLMAALEESAILLADTYATEASHLVARANILLSVRVMDSRWTMGLHFPSTTDIQESSWSHIQDSIQLPVESIAQFAKHGLGKVLFIAYNAVEDFLLPDTEPIRFQTLPSEGGEPYISKDTFHSSSYVVNSRVIAASVGRQRNNRIPQPVVVTLKHLHEQNISEPQCVFWSYDTQAWSTEGCWVQSFNRSHTVCSCDHLTNFAVLMEVHPMEGTLNNQFWEQTVSVLASCIGTIVLLLIALCLLYLLRFTRTEQTYIHRHLAASLLVSEIIFILGIHQTQSAVICGFVAGFLQYFVLVAFAWTFFEGFHLYNNLVEPAEAQRSRLIWYCALAYTAPAAVVFVSAIVDPSSFGTKQYCWLRADNYFIFSFVAPMVGVVFGCVVFLCIAACVLCHQNGLSTTVKGKEEAKLNRLRSTMYWVTGLLLMMTLCWTSSVLHIVKYATPWAFVFAGFNAALGIYVLLFTCWKCDTVHDELCRVLSESRLTPSCLKARFTPGSPEHVMVNGGSANALHAQQSWNTQDKNSTLTHKYTIPTHPSMDTVLLSSVLTPTTINIASPHHTPNTNKLSSPTTPCIGDNIPQGRLILHPSAATNSLLRRSSASNNISGINQHAKTLAPKVINGGDPQQQQRPIGQWVQWGTHSGAGRRGHYGSEASSVCSAFADHIYESIDQGGAPRLNNLMVGGGTSTVGRVPPPPAPDGPIDYGDFSDMSQHSSSSFGATCYDQQRPLLVIPGAKFPPGNTSHGPPTLDGLSRHGTIDRAEVDRVKQVAANTPLVKVGNQMYSPQQLYEVALAHRLHEAAASQMASDPQSSSQDDEEDWSGATTDSMPDLMPQENGGTSAVIAVLDGEKVVSRIGSDNGMVSAPSNASGVDTRQGPMASPQRYNLSTYC